MRPTSTGATASATPSAVSTTPMEIGRASCRERGEISGGAVSFKKKNEIIGRQGVTLTHETDDLPRSESGPYCAARSPLRAFLCSLTLRTGSQPSKTDTCRVLTPDP